MKERGASHNLKTRLKEVKSDCLISLSGFISKEI